MRNDLKKFLKGKIVLQEVYDELARTGGPVDVVCSVDDDYKPLDVINFLNRLDIAVTGKNHEQTDCFVFAVLKNDKEAKKIDSPPKNAGRQCIGHVWLDKVMKGCVLDSKKTINAHAALQI